jgi:hypothetical protein
MVVYVTTDDGLIYLHVTLFTVHHVCLYDFFLQVDLNFPNNWGIVISNWLDHPCDELILRIIRRHEHIMMLTDM